MRIALITAALFCMAGNVQANSSGHVSYESHTVSTWGAAESGGSHGTPSRRDRRRARRAERKAAGSCHGTLSYAAPVVSYAAPVAAEVTCEACAPVAAIAAPVYVASAPVYVPIVRQRAWRRPIVLASPMCITGTCNQP